MTQMACASDVHVERAGSAHLTGWRICLPSFPPSYAHGLPGRSKGRRGVKVVNGGRQKTSRKAVVGPCTSACIMQAFAVRIPIASTGRPGRGVALCRAFGWIPIVGAQVSRSSPFVQRWAVMAAAALTLLTVRRRSEVAQARAPQHATVYDRCPFPDGKRLSLLREDHCCRYLRSARLPSLPCLSRNTPTHIHSTCDTTLSPKTKQKKKQSWSR